MRSFIVRRGGAEHFWSVDARDGMLFLWYGKAGTPGRRQSIGCRTPERAEAELARRVREKLAEGYVEVTAPAGAETAPPRTPREALEAALAEDPDDFAAHSAYADLLTEQGDPRGEFIRVQLALEDESRSPQERKQLRRRERELLDAHERQWLGELAPYLLGTEEERFDAFVADLNDPGQQGAMEHFAERFSFRYGWRRGWLDTFEGTYLTVELARRLGRHPLARLLRVLRVEDDRCTSNDCRVTWGLDLPNIPTEDEWFQPCEVLRSYPAVRNLKVFQFGEAADPEQDRYEIGTQFRHLAPLISRMARIEDLYLFGHCRDYHEEPGRIFSLPNLTNLRVLQYYHGLHYPLEALAANPALGRLTHLLCFPHDFAPPPGEEVGTIDGRTAISRAGVRAVVTSPHLRSLTHLQLRCCDGGDATIEDVVASGIVKRLRVLDLRHGNVTDAGARALAACPDARGLEIDLTNNRLTGRGVGALRRAGIAVRADRQQKRPYRRNHILYYGDSE